MIARSEIRRHVRLQRRALSARQRRERSQRITTHLATLPEFQRGVHIALYLPNDGEAAPTELLEVRRAHGKYWYLPVLGLAYENRLWFMPYRPGTTLVPNRFGIPEPVSRRRNAARKPWALDLVLTPLVAFDAAGNRLGMGGGFYDRSLGFLRQRQHWRKPRLIGVAYAFQQVEQLPTADWDVPLDAIVTEQGVVRPRTVEPVKTARLSER